MIDVLKRAWLKIRMMFGHVPASAAKACDGPVVSVMADLHYESIWFSAGNQIRQGMANTVNGVADRILRHKSEYMLVQDKTGVPWFLVGAIHNLEASCDFTTYLHNGDPLGRPTTHVPRGIMFGKDQWHLAAIDALRREGMTRQTVWHLEHILYWSERYNGMGYARRGVNSPYVWSMTRAYSKGKYTGDGVYDPNAVSKQVGVAAVLTRLVDLKQITIITSRGNIGAS